MFVFSLWVFAHQRTLSLFNHLCITAVLLFLMASLVRPCSMFTFGSLADQCQHFAVDAYRIVAAFITYRDAPGGPVAYLGAVSNTSYIVKTTAAVAQTLIGDACMVRRLHAVRHLQLSISRYTAPM